MHHEAQSEVQPTSEHPSLAVAALVACAASWGVVWYPYRLLAGQGLGGVAATTLTSAVALGVGAILWRRRLGGWRDGGWLLAALALSGGLCNMSYVVATLGAEVMRVVLLFYLAPLWTVLLARLLLGERLTLAGGGVIAAALAGALVMLWRPELGLPLPASGAEWLGLVSGVLFALSNVLSRKARAVGTELRTLAVFAGTLVPGIILGLAGVDPLPAAVGASTAAIVAVVGVAILATSLAMQYGLARTPAMRAIVILLAEPVFAAFFSWLLAGETMDAREWFGGALIVAASLISGRIESS